jgi:hypothetical protein
MEQQCAKQPRGRASSEEWPRGGQKLGATKQAESQQAERFRQVGEHQVKNGQEGGKNLEQQNKQSQQAESHVEEQQAGSSHAGKGSNHVGKQQARSHTKEQ